MSIEGFEDRNFDSRPQGGEASEGSRKGRARSDNVSKVKVTGFGQAA